MKNFAIAVIAGDGVGHEVIPAAKQVLVAAGRKASIEFAFADFDWGSDYYFHHGRMMPVNGLDLLRPHSAILLGAIGHTDIPDNITLNGLLLPIRRTFDQYANVRPASFFPVSRARWQAKRAATSPWWWFARTPKGSTRRWAALFTTTDRRKWPFRPRCLRATAANA